MNQLVAKENLEVLVKNNMEKEIKNLIKDALKNLTIEVSDIVLRPAWLTHLPKDPNRISVKSAR